MERQANPYRPGFNQAPLVLAGRDTVIAGAREAFEVAARDGRTPRPLILMGPRGLGKTVTLGEIVSVAESSYSWVAVRAEAKAGLSLITDLTQRLAVARMLLDGQDPSAVRRRRTRITGGHVGAKALGVEAAIELERTEGSDENLLSALRRTMEQALQRPPGAGVIVTLDELQNAPQHELELIAGTLQETVPENWPLVVAVAALPSLRRTRGKRRLPTYLERAEWHVLGDLPEDAARQALAGPAQQAGRPMSAQAQNILLSVAGGYPYAIQLAGHYAWRASHGHASITARHARAAVPAIDAELATLFQGRWEDASPKEREYLRALAQLVDEGATPGGGTVATRLGEDAHAVSYLRERLLKKGTIYNTGDGRLHFITPGMGSWILATDHAN